MILRSVLKFYLVMFLKLLIWIKEKYEIAFEHVYENTCQVM